MRYPTSIAYFGVRLDPEQAAKVYPLLIESLMSRSEWAEACGDEVFEAVNGLPGFWPEGISHSSETETRFEAGRFHGVGIRVADDDFDNLYQLPESALAEAAEAYEAYLGPFLNALDITATPQVLTLEQTF